MVKIRTAALKDIEGLMQLEKEAKREIKEWILMKREEFAELTMRNLMYIAEEKKEVVGYISVKIVGEKIIIYDVYVRRELRRRGIGGKLTDKMLTDLEKTQFKNVTITCPAILRRFHDRYGHEAMEAIMRGEFR